MPTDKHPIPVGRLQWRPGTSRASFSLNYFTFRGWVDVEGIHVTLFPLNIIFLLYEVFYRDKIQSVTATGRKDTRFLGSLNKLFSHFYREIAPGTSAPGRCRRASHRAETPAFSEDAYFLKRGSLLSLLWSLKGLASLRTDSELASWYIHHMACLDINSKLWLVKCFNCNAFLYIKIFFSKKLFNYLKVELYL